jgi:hypothetical protein
MRLHHKIQKIIKENILFLKKDPSFYSLSVKFEQFLTVE